MDGQSLSYWEHLTLELVSLLLSMPSLFLLMVSGGLSAKTLEKQPIKWKIGRKVFETTISLEARENAFCTLETLTGISLAYRKHL